MLPVSAAGESGDRDGHTTALVFTVSRGRLTGIEPLPVTLAFSDYAGGIYRVAGRLAEPVPDAISRAELNWVLRMDTGAGSLQPIPGMSGYKGTMFWAAFNIPANRMAEPRHFTIRIMAHTPHEERT
jgi:hypothetical protein